MVEEIRIRRGEQPLPIRDGLNPTRVRAPQDFARAFDFLWHLISTQRRRHPQDTQEALAMRFDAQEILASRGHRAWVLDPESPIEEGTDIWFYRTPHEEVPVPYECTVVHEDADLLIVNKPPFLATMPRGKHITQTATVLMRRATGNNELSPAHRLDRATSGILVFTKNRAVRGAYQELFARREVQKTYEAIADHDSDLLPGTLWRDRMEKIPGNIQGTIEAGEPNAETLLSAVFPVSTATQIYLEEAHGRKLSPQAVYELQPHTGKTHQLRLHMNKAGVPILGDLIYPRIEPEEAEDLAVPMHLTSVGIAFLDPLNGKPREFFLPGERGERVWLGA